MIALVEVAPIRERIEPRRVGVTGMGIVSPIGKSVSEVQENSRQGVNGVIKYDFGPTPYKVAGIVQNYDTKERLGKLYKKGLNRIARVQAFSLDASYQALLSRGIVDENGNWNPEYDPERFGVIIGTGTGGSYSIIEANDKLREGKDIALSDLFGAQPERVQSMVNMRFGLKGPSFSVTAACATGTIAIDSAWRLIRYGAADGMLAGGTESTQNPVTAGLFGVARAPTLNPDPETASRPMDVNRDGFVLSEGAGVLFLEEYEHAKQRGVPIIAELVASVVNNDAGHDTAPGDGPLRGLKQLIREAEIKPNEPVYINLHSTSTKAGDVEELESIYEAFNGEVGNLYLSGPKSMVGHTLGGAGGVETVIALSTFEDNVIPPTIHTREIDPKAESIKDQVVLGDEGRFIPEGIEVIIKEAFGFGGENGLQAYRRTS